MRRSTKRAIGLISLIAVPSATLATMLYFAPWQWVALLACISLLIVILVFTLGDGGIDLDIDFD